MSTTLFEIIEQLETHIVLLKEGKSHENKPDLIPGLKAVLRICQAAYPKSFNELQQAFDFGKLAGKTGLNLSSSGYCLLLPECNNKKG